MQKMFAPILNRNAPCKLIWEGLHDGGRWESAIGNRRKLMGNQKCNKKKFSTMCRPLFVSFVRFEVHLYSYGCGLQTVEAITLLVILVSKIASQHAVLLPKSCEFDKTNTAPLNTIKIKKSLNRFFHQLFAAKEIYPFCSAQTFSLKASCCNACSKDISVL